MTKRRVNIIGAGYSGLSSACYLAKQGFDVHIYEKNDSIGGRSRAFKDGGYTFDMGPSWYWMPDVFENFFKDFGKKPSDYYQLKRLDPSYRVYFQDETYVDLPANLEELYRTFESIEPGSAKQLKKFLDDAAYKYEVGINDLVQKPSKSLTEFMRWDVIKGAVKLQLFKSFSSFARKYFKNPKLLQIIEFPVLFLGAKPQNIPALYSLMNYADIVGGTWYPMGGMHEVIKGMASLAEELGVTIHTNCDIKQINVENSKVYSIDCDDDHIHTGDALIASADYHHVEQKLLKKEFRKYSDSYWDGRTMAPSCLLFYLGVNKKLENLLHHNLFFDEDFNQHAVEIYDTPQWPSKPLFYACVPSITDPSVAPEGKENLFLLVPIAPDLEDNEETREKYFEMVMNRLEKLTNQEIKSHIEYKKSYAINDFKKDYNAFKGNAYGLANTLKQTAILKPSINNPKVKNLFYAGQLTVPGPGVPPSLISGKLAAQEVEQYLK